MFAVAEGGSDTALAERLGVARATVLRTIDAQVLHDLDIHLAPDNAVIHKAPATKRRLAAHPRFVLHFTRQRRQLPQAQY